MAYTPAMAPLTEEPGIQCPALLSCMATALVDPADGALGRQWQCQANMEGGSVAKGTSASSPGPWKTQG